MHFSFCNASDVETHALEHTIMTACLVSESESRVLLSFSACRANVVKDSSSQTNMFPFSLGRFGSYTRLFGRSHGELGAHHFQRDQPAGGQTVVSSGKAISNLHHSTRACPSGKFVLLLLL